MSLARRVTSRRFLALLLIGALLLLLAVLASLGLRRVGRSATPPDRPCSPRPCAAPHGFQVYLTSVQLSGGVLMMAVRFKNQTTSGFEGVSYRHTSPADFQLRAGDGNQSPPQFSSLCPRWPQLRVERGASAGPVPLCFPAPAGDYRDSQVIWSPDLGLLFDDIQIPLK